jgi:hypothetical protein
LLTSKGHAVIFTHHQLARIKTSAEVDELTLSKDTGIKFFMVINYQKHDVTNSRRPESFCTGIGAVLITGISATGS